jgi:hypothetical protein
MRESPPGLPRTSRRQPHGPFAHAKCEEADGVQWTRSTRQFDSGASLATIYAYSHIHMHIICIVFTD